MNLIELSGLPSAGQAPGPQRRASHLYDRGVLRLRLATVDDRPTLELWDTYQHVIDSGGLDDGLDWSIELTRSVDWQEILIGELDGVPIGVV